MPKTNDEILKEFKEKEIHKKAYIIKHVDLSFFALKEPKTTGKYPSNKFEADVLILKDAFEEKCADLIKGMKEAAVMISGDKKSDYTLFTQSITDMDDTIVEGDKYAKYKEGRFRIRAKSGKYQPDLRNADKTVMSEEDKAKFSMGDLVNISVNIFAHKAPQDTIVNGKKKKIEVVRFSLGLLAVQRVKASSGSGVSTAGDVFEDESVITEDDFKDESEAGDEFD